MNSLPDFNSAKEESHSLKNLAIAEYDHSSAFEILNQAKVLVMAYWQGSQYCTTVDVAEWYGVTQEVIRDNVRRNKEELRSDGIKVVKGRELKAIRPSFNFDRSTAILNLWTPKAVLKLGLFLRDSQTAIAVRKLLGSPNPERPLTFTEYDIQSDLNQLKQGTREKRLPSKRRIDILDGIVITEVKRGVITARHVGQLFEYLHETGLKEGNMVGSDIADCALALIQSLRKSGYLITFTKFHRQDLRRSTK